MITALCGGVGGSKLVLGLSLTLPPEELTVVVNTADDLQFCGLHVSPDLDTVVYTLAGLSRQDVGWGIEGDTFEALDMLRRYGAATWFQVGDRDLATDLFRTMQLRSGQSLTEVTASIAQHLGVGSRILPMTDGAVATRLSVGGEWLDFQEYFVHRRHTVPVDAIRYDRNEGTGATAAVLESIVAAEAIVLVNSNPALSLLPILTTPGVNEAIVGATAPCVAVSPIVGTDAVTGPAGRLMALLGHANSAVGVAEAYLGIVDGMVIDHQDADRQGEIEALGLDVLVTGTIMRTVADRARLASETISFARTLG